MTLGQKKRPIILGVWPGDYCQASKKRLGKPLGNEDEQKWTYLDHQKCKT